jgi:poly(3-hydroxybutyrate) depolymerase
MAGAAGKGGKGGGGGSAGAAAGSGGAAGGGAAMKSAGCDKARTIQDGNRMVQSGGSQRTYVLRTPTNYDSTRPYRLILGFHGANGRGADIAPSYFGLVELSQNSTIFAAPDAVSGLWNATTDKTMVTDLLTQLEDGLCIDKSRVLIEGFSQGGAMVWTLACALPGTFRLAIVHSGGGLAMPQTCQPIPFFSSLGNDGSGQGMSSDFFARANGCMVTTMPMPPAGGHVCTDYGGCSAGHPTRWCDYDGGHTAAPVDQGTQGSWMPGEVWRFITQND